MAMRDSHEFTLSDEQVAARDCPDRFVAVLASAGSGKTEVVAQRVERILATGGGFRVVALSYTRRAAAELRYRFSLRLGPAEKRVDTDTIHGFAHRLLLQYGTWIGLPSEPSVVASDADRVALLQDWREASGLPLLEDPKAEFDRIDLARARMQPSSAASDWESAMAEAGALDYESMLTKAAELLQLPAVAALIARLYRHMVVDEAQNLTASQYELLKCIAKAGESESSLVLVGDDKQSIVGFAGASPDYLRDFVRDFDATVIRLSQNFRSAARIVEAGCAIAAALGDPEPREQDYAAEGLMQRIDFADEVSEAAGVAGWVRELTATGVPESAVAPGEDLILVPAEIAILGRTARSLRACERALEAQGFQVNLASHADDWLTSETVRKAWLLSSFKPESSVSRRRVERELDLKASTADELFTAATERGFGTLAEFARMDGPADFVEAIAALQIDDAYLEGDQEEVAAAWQGFCDHSARDERSWSQFELFVARRQAGDREHTGIHLLTVHKAQGREYKAVAVVGLNDGQFPDFRARSNDEVEAELRAFYVAITRPSRVLLLTRPASITTRNGQWQREPSRFLRHLPQ